MGSLPNAWTASVWKVTPASWQRPAISRDRLDDADLVVDPHDRDDGGALRPAPRRARRGRACPRCPPAGAPLARRGGRRRGRLPGPPCARRADTAAHMGAPRSRAASAAPTMLRLSASVPPEVKITWLGSAPERTRLSLGGPARCRPGPPGRTDARWTGFRRPGR